VGYVGNKGTWIFGASENGRELNPATYIPGQSTVGNAQSRRPYQDYSRIGLYESSNNTNYHSMVANLEKRFSGGLTLLANYTWSKKFDDYGWTNPYSRRFDYGLSREDVTHNVKFSNVWEIPHFDVSRGLGAVLNGWMLNGMVTWQSGFPFSVTTGRDNSLTGVNRDRADYIGTTNPNLSQNRSHGEMVARFFDTSVFTENALGTFGNSGKGILRGPRMFNFDMGLLKNNRIGERYNLQFRAEFFNAFNNVNFNMPNSTFTSAQFGRITSALDPRILQFSLKLLF
jgi:hypothetical protein